MRNGDTRVRLYGIAIAVTLLIAFTIMIAINYVSGDIVWAFYPGLFVGVLFGIAFCLHLSENWDPKALAMKPSAQNKTEGRLSWTWGPPLGVLVGNVIAQFFGNGVRNLFMGVLVGWIYLFIGYMAIATWRHRPK